METRRYCVSSVGCKKYRSRGVAQNPVTSFHFSSIREGTRHSGGNFSNKSLFTVCSNVSDTFHKCVVRFTSLMDVMQLLIIHSADASVNFQP